MATCPSCGREIRDDVWTCGFCGATVAQPAAAEAHRPADGGGEDSAYGSEGYNPYAAQAAASSAYGAARYGVEPGPAGLGGGDGTTPYGTPPQGRPAPSGGLSTATKAVLAAAAVAVVAIVALWFFVVRGQGGGEQFVGTWTAVKNGQGGLVVERGGDGLQASLIGSDQERVGPLRCDLDGDELEIKLEAAGGSDEEKAAVEVARALFEATVEDFRMVLNVRDADGRLLLTVSGRAKGGGEATTLPPTEFVRAGTATAP